MMTYLEHSARDTNCGGILHYHALMLRSVSLSTPFRSLGNAPFADIGLGAKTVIYGHNGSGKSTLAQLLLAIGEGDLDAEVTWSGIDGVDQKIGKLQKPTDVAISVFTKSWVAKNLHAFLDGDSAASIVTLGKDAIEAKAEEKRIERDLKKVEKELDSVEKQYRISTKGTSVAVRSVQSSIESTLRPVNYERYTKNRYNEPKVRTLLERLDKNYSTESDYISNLEEVKRPALSGLRPISPPPIAWEQLKDKVNNILNLSVESELIAELTGNGTIQRWVQEGLALHQDVDNCMFCSQEITLDRRSTLARHFDDSRQKVQRAAQEILDATQRYRDDLQRWRASLPALQDVYPQLHELWKLADKTQETTLHQAIFYLDEIDELAQKKHDEPERMGLGPMHASSPDFTEIALTELVATHNRLCDTTDSRRESLCEAILGYLIGSQSSSFKILSETEKKLGEKKLNLKKSILKLEDELKKVREKQFSNLEMAEHISADLANVYGKNHLRIEVIEGGKSYRCCRGNEGAKNLSDGERNTLALLYFLRHLQDESSKVPPEQRLVVIDDPSSSLDRESVFATHSWLLDMLTQYGQSIIMTHDFEMLRLLLISQKNQVSKTRSTIRRGESSAIPEERAKANKEKQFPRVQFLEMHAGAGPDGERTSSIKPISSSILDHPSEYHYLFDRVMHGLKNPEDTSVLFLLPNAARRLLESFVSFRAPNLSNFNDQLKKLALEDRNDAYRDVYDFCNRHSHGEGRETKMTLDTMAVEGQLRRCMEFLEEVDAEHFKGMCEATGHASYATAARN